MTASVLSNATPAMLVWARKHAGYSCDDVATAEKVEVEKIVAWESGEGSPSLAMLRRLANRYKRPLMVFYLPEPPSDFTVVKDFRFLPDSETREFSPELLLAIRRAQERQSWAVSYLESISADRCGLVASTNVTPGVYEIAHRLRRELAVSLADQSQCATDSAAYALWKKSVEALGVFVFQLTGVAVEETRGFALSNAFAPVIAVNGMDSYTAKTFTLLHEVVHILLGVSAIYGGRPSATEPRDKVERFCNRVAAEVLVPHDDFVPRVPSDWNANDGVFMSFLSAASKRYRVSRQVIGLRLIEVGLASTEYIGDKWGLLQVQPRKREPGPIPQYVLAIARLGESFTKLGLSAYYAGDIHGGSLSELLGMKLKHLPPLESRLYPSRIQPFLKAQ